MITKENIWEHNFAHEELHKRQLDHLATSLTDQGIVVEDLLKKLDDFQIAIPSWALGTGGTRFGRFPEGGEPRSLDEKIEDVGLLHQLSGSCNAISLHIPWDIPDDAQAIKSLANSFGLKFDAVNSNTFQDQPNASFSYKFGSLCHVDKAVREEAIAHNKSVIDHGVSLGSKALTVWLADGSNFPGQHNFREALKRTQESLEEIYAYLPGDWHMLIEYKPYEPNFYSMVIPDWGTSHLLASQLGEKALSLVDLGHHLPNTNIEQIVAILMMREKLGGFHFNDSKYGDDDLTTGSLKPYQLFLIFNELIDGTEHTGNPPLSWMIDASHNLKDPLEDLLQAVEAIKIAYAQALIVNRLNLEEAQRKNDVARAQQILQDAFRTDVRPLVAASRLRQGGVFDPVTVYRQLEIRKNLIQKRGTKTISTGL
ncbi:TIM barrel protein [Fulvivirgaceae bacterium BMA10]|uniref:TIM barrel protein n=1 Tax=Splendidivirga corallicola TaxID=3051826 RepID=A0ABT8KI26_9BACT|nr:TIM barrel protein [Fulvivirgaceae bacterium BMA10]